MLAELEDVREEIEEVEGDEVTLPLEAGEDTAEVVPLGFDWHCAP